MTQLASFLLLLAGCAGVAATMTRHRRDLGWTAIGTRGRLLGKATAIALFCASFGVAVVERGWGIGSIEWTCLFGLSALTLAIALNHLSQIRRF